MNWYGNTDYSNARLEVTVGEDEKLAEQPKECLNLNLYPFQLQSLSRMRSIEENPVLKGKDLDGSVRSNGLRLVKCESRVGILANKPGSGKSAVVLSLCAEPCATKNANSIQKSNSHCNREFEEVAIDPIEVQTNLIVTNPKLLMQWAGYMANFRIPHFAITNVTKVPASLDDMVALCHEKRIIFISTSTLKHIRPYIERIRFDRIFFDEIDSMDFPGLSHATVHSNFIWWVTATPQSFIAHNSHYYRKYGTERILNISSEFHFFKEYLQNLTCFRAHEIRQKFMVRCSEEEIEACLALPPYTVESIIVPRSTAMRLTQGIIENGEFQNYLRGDRLDQAISLLNVTGQTITTLAEAARLWMETTINNLQAEIDFVQKTVPTTPEQATRQQERIVSLNHDIFVADKKKQLLLARIAEAPECMICCDTMVNPVATKCCTQAFCSECMKQWLKSSARKSCPNCRTTLDERKDFITYQPKNTNSSSKDNNRDEGNSAKGNASSKKRKASEISTTTAAAVAPAQSAQPAPIAQSAPTTKLQALLQTLRVTTKSLLYVQSVAGGESISRMTEAINQEGIEVLSLVGHTAASCMKIIERFRDSPQRMCLLVSSIQHSAGFNLQFVDTIIMYQRMGERETQIIGRGMRPGRTVPLKVVRILYAGSE